MSDTVQHHLKIKYPAPPGNDLHFTVNDKQTLKVNTCENKATFCNI